MLESIPDLSDLLITAPLAVIVLIFMYLSDKQKNKLIESINKTIEKLIDVIKDMKK